ncbi:MAG: ABC transporter substrate-binding protein [Bacteroidales bacterium]|jgi:LysM repeat protein/ABC-type branched-subunit amino acid transport system substrate-binding protein|nr:ABC transporter substrate-binding protein [Bacteroidales bacterium]
MNRILNCLVIAFACITNVNAQQAQDTLIENGKLFLIHKVERGQTLYGLSKTYNIAIEEIIKYNPQTENGIKAREELKIYIGEEKKLPIQEPKAEILPKDTARKIVHTVVAGETLYGLSKKYNVSIEQLQKWNPGLNENLSIGQNIILFGKSDTSVNDTITYYQIPKQAIKKSSYKVYALLPLYTNYLYRVDTSTFKSLSDYDDIKSFHFIQFYEGLLIAAEDASKKGIPIKLYVEDINDQNTNKLKEMIQKGVFDDVDLILGPFFSDEFALLSDYVKNKNIILVNPFSITFDECNRNTYKVTASYQQQAEQIVKYITQKHDKAQIILINNQSSGDVMKTNAYKTGMLNAISDTKQISIKEINYAQEGIGGIQAAINPNCENYLFTFFTGEINITNFVQRMYGLKYENVTLFVPSFWKEYDNIETEYFMSLKTHYVDPFFVDYSDPNVITFIDKFREKYEIEPTLDKFAFQGYDITFYFLNALMNYGSNFGLEVNEMELPLLSTKIYFKQSPTHCKENTFVHIYKLKDFKIINAYSDIEEEQITPTISPKK